MYHNFFGQVYIDKSNQSEDYYINVNLTNIPESDTPCMTHIPDCGTPCLSNIPESDTPLCRLLHTGLSRHSETRGPCSLAYIYSRQQIWK